ncbi:MAG: dTMP kinase [Chlorobium sp.]|uniref:dTMP kinase n=1 Tax=Chlorobium sp. TaxID=1095 RepID=UPI0025C6CAB8|nr:dTMP kinase [Chlorobium sp.]MCF8381975.1 dTMP kinase [Chlorobium sp.]
MLITFEGIDGAGKSTQIRKLQKLLAEKQCETIVLREPGGTEIAEKIRQILLESRHDITPVGELLLFSASRAELVQQVILPAIAEGKTVILDRFFDSTTAYQGYGRGLDAEMLQSIIRLSTFSLHPDITFYLDISPENAMLRKFSEKSLPLALEENELDRMERSGSDFYQRVRKGYHRIIEGEKNRFVVLDALDNPEKLHKEIVASLGERFPAFSGLRTP